ncbi:PAS domain-containing protein [Bradyrhizobium sp. McL0616]|uniref:PAS domain-containing protein n=1 Tax=Bradyrhizobium sp. McL0616 TaxID=3415674 RepID=UPI003CEA0F83
MNHREVETSLHECEQQVRWLTSIMEASDDAIVSKHLDGTITRWNRGAERIFGYSPEMAIGQPITLVIPEERRSEERKFLTRLRQGERIDHFETVRQTKHGSRIAVSLTISPVADAKGKIIGALKIARDITEKKTREMIKTLAVEGEHRDANPQTAMQYLKWALEHIEKADNQKAAHHARIAFEALRKGVQPTV